MRVMVLFLSFRGRLRRPGLPGLPAYGGLVFSEKTAPSRQSLKKESHDPQSFLKQLHLNGYLAQSLRLLLLLGDMNPHKPGNRDRQIELPHYGFKNGQRSRPGGNRQRIPISDRGHGDKAKIDEMPVIRRPLVHNLKRARLDGFQKKINKAPHETKEEIAAHGSLNHFGGHLLIDGR